MVFPAPRRRPTRQLEAPGKDSGNLQAVLCLLISNQTRLPKFSSLSAVIGAVAMSSLRYADLHTVLH